MIVMYKGRRGCGKTTTLVKDGFNYFKAGWRIYTNMSGLSFPHTKIATKDIAELHNSRIRDSVILIDEIQAIVSSRRSMRKENLSFSNFIHEVRKRGIVILSTTQKVRRVDVDYRDQIDIVVSPKFYPEYPIVEATYIDLTAEDENMEGIIDSFNTIVYDPRQVFNLFDSYEKVKSIN